MKGKVILKSSAVFLLTLVMGFLVDVGLLVMHGDCGTQNEECATGKHYIAYGGMAITLVLALVLSYRAAVRKKS